MARVAKKRGRGRPPKPRGEQAEVTTSLRLYQSDIERIERLMSLTESPSKAEVIRAALELYEKRIDKAEESDED